MDFSPTCSLTFYWDNELRNNRKNLASTVLQQVMDSLTSKKLIWKFCFTKPIKEQRQKVMIVQIFNLYLKIKNK